MVMRKVEPLSAMRPVLHALLKPRWDLDPKRGRCVTGRRELALDDHLPPETQTEYLVGRLRRVPRASLSAAEKRLARWVQIILPAGADAAKYVAELRTWPCFAEVHVAPQPSLPSPGAT
jgi:hypothetical protein